MAKVACKSCGKEIIDTSSFCEHCGASVSNSEPGFLKRYLTPSTTEENIQNVFLVAKIIRYIHVTLGVLLAFGAFVSLLNEDDAAGVMLFSLIPLTLSAFISPIFIEWQGHLLKNVYEINKNTKKR